MAMEAFSKRWPKNDRDCRSRIRSDEGLADSFAKFSDSDIANLEMMKTGWERFLNFLEVVWAELQSVIKNWPMISNIHPLDMGTSPGPLGIARMLDRAMDRVVAKDIGDDKREIRMPQM